MSRRKGYFPDVGDVTRVSVGNVVADDLLPAVRQQNSVLAVGVVAGPEFGYTGSDSDKQH